ncbi:MAG: hypothetical protein IJ356_07110 [Erysipelotrichaceae bacterium]|nr:hypothetical protein [Erysipelotrichaceae bacterium]
MDVLDLPVIIGTVALIALIGGIAIAVLRFVLRIIYLVVPVIVGFRIVFSLAVGLKSVYTLKKILLILKMS